MRIVAVVGAGECTNAETDFARSLGSRVARKGYAIVTGGLGGVMEAACRGASEAGGLTIGILPGSDRSAANPFVQISLPSGLGELRNGLVVAMGEVIVAVGGEYGTLSEIALALKREKPVIGWQTWLLEEYRALPRSIIRVASIDDACQEIERALSYVERS